MNFKMGSMGFWLFGTMVDYWSDSLFCFLPTSIAAFLKLHKLVNLDKPTVIHVKSWDVHQLRRPHPPPHLSILDGAGSGLLQQVDGLVVVEGVAAAHHVA